MRGCLFTSCYPRLRSGAGRTPFPIFHIKRDTTPGLGGRGAAGSQHWPERAVVGLADPLAGLFDRDGLPAVEKVRRTPVSTFPYDGAGLCFR